jgi:outer membrane protein assembly factor BamB
MIKKSVIVLGSVFFVAGLYLQAQTASDIQKNWHQWRGPYMTGVSPDGDPPTEWSETKNIKWKIAIPGKGHATPIIWKDRVFILTAVETDKQGQAKIKAQEQESGSQRGRGRGMPTTRTTKIHEFVVLAINRDDGKILWQKTVTEEIPLEGTHEFGSWASHSPVTDGEYIYAYFGSRGLYCLDMEGNIKWERDFGQLSKHMNFGEGSSPAIYGDKIIVTWDHSGPSFIIAVDKETGRDIWRVDRDEETSWATPYVVEVGGKPQVITSATKLIRSYDLETGELIWECSGMTMNCIPTPFAAEGILYVMSGFRGNALLAIRLAGAKGNITDTDAIVWKHDKDTPYAPSPLLNGNYMYFLRGNNGILSCFDAKTGKSYYTAQRLEGMGNIFASLFGAKDRIYITGQKGTFYVVKQGPEFTILGKNTLDDNFSASPVAVGKQLFLRGYKNLYCIEQE